MHIFAQLHAVIDLCDDLQAKRNLPADVIFKHYTKNRRYIGSKDRRAIADLFYETIRNWSGLAQLLEDKPFPDSHTPHVVMLAALMFSDIQLPIDGNFNVPHAPHNLSAATVTRLNKLAQTAVLPSSTYFDEQLKAQYNVDYPTLRCELKKQAPTCMRVSINVSRDDVLENPLLSHATKTPHSPFGIKTYERLSHDVLQQNPTLTIQDEGAQIITALCPVAAGMEVLDLCAGAGGKALALADLHPKAEIYATDYSAKRLANIHERMHRAHVKNMHVLPYDHAMLRKYVFDMVVLDVPCSGSGTLRRSADLYLKLTQDDLATLTGIQRELLEKGAKMVKPGGWLVYITCSLFAEENQAQRIWFESAWGGFEVVDLTHLWKERFSSPYLGQNPYELSLLPHLHQTDGFYCFMAKKKEAM